MSEYENPFDRIRADIGRAEQLNRAADSVANDMAYMLRGRLRNVKSWNLDALKRELRDYNIHTRTWKS